MKKLKLLLLPVVFAAGLLVGEFVGVYDVIPDSFGGGSGFGPTKYNNVTTTTYTTSNIASVSAQLIAKNTERNWLRCVNNGPKTVFLNLGSSATKYQAPYEVRASGSFELLFNQNPYIGAVAAVTADDVASTSIRFTCSEGVDRLTGF